MSTNAIDEAYRRRFSGEVEGALRLGTHILEVDPSQLSAALLLTEALIEEGRGRVATEVALRLVDAFVRRGDLPRAVTAARVAESGGESLEELLAPIAEAFAHGSPRVTDVAPVPPPLPPETDLEALSEVMGDALLDRAETALQSYLGTSDELSGDRPVPALPLFARLGAEPLAHLLEAFQVHVVGAGEEVIAQGAEGEKAFVVVRGMLRVLRHGEDGQETVLAGLGPGALFGEMALVSDAPRAASVVAAETATLLEVSREALERVAQRDPVVGEELARFCRDRMLSNLVRHSAILGSVAPSERQALVSRFDTIHFQSGDTLIAEGTEGDGLYLIASGAVEILGSDEDGDALRIAELGPGDVVGEISLVLRRPANASVRALHPTVTLHLGREQFQAAIREHPTLLSELYETATARDEQTRSVVAQEALDVEDVILL